MSLICALTESELVISFSLIRDVYFIYSHKTPRKTDELYQKPYKP